MSESPPEQSPLDKMEIEMNSVIENLEKSISRLKGKQNDDKRLDRCTQLLKKLGGLIESLKLDIASMESTNLEKKLWERKLVENETKMNELKVEFNDKRREVQKKMLLKSGTPMGEKLKNLTGEEDVTQLDKQQALHVGDVLLDKAEKSLARTKKLVVESEQMGINTLQKMETQNESAVNDRCVQVLTLFVFIAVVIVLVQQFTGKKTTAAPALRRLVVAAVTGGDVVSELLNQF